MAFISMLLAAGLIWLLFLIWIGAIVLGIVLLALFFVLLRSNKKARKKWKKVLAIVCLALSIGCMSLAAWGCYAATHSSGASMTVQMHQGPVCWNDRAKNAEYFARVAEEQQLLPEQVQEALGF